jgi:hypothetical protein
VDTEYSIQKIEGQGTFYNSLKKILVAGIRNDPAFLFGYPIFSLRASDAICSTISSMTLSAGSFKGGSECLKKRSLK